MQGVQLLLAGASAWRMDPTKKLVVPEINGSILTKRRQIIPNATVSHSIMALAPLHKKIQIKRVIVSPTNL
jgi:aspartate-semialdehyde dehydrogenase